MLKLPFSKVSDGENASAAKIQANFAAIESYLNGGITRYATLFSGNDYAYSVLSHVDRCVPELNADHSYRWGYCDNRHIFLPWYADKTPGDTYSTTPAIGKVETPGAGFGAGFTALDDTGYDPVPPGAGILAPSLFDVLANCVSIDTSNIHNFGSAPLQFALHASLWVPAWQSELGLVQAVHFFAHKVDLSLFTPADNPLDYAPVGDRFTAPFWETLPCYNDYSDTAVDYSGTVAWGGANQSIDIDFNGGALADKNSTRPTAMVTAPDYIFELDKPGFGGVAYHNGADTAYVKHETSYDITPYVTAGQNLFFISYCVKNDLGAATTMASISPSYPATTFPARVGANPADFNGDQNRFRLEAVVGRRRNKHAELEE